MQYRSNDVVELILLTAIEYAPQALHVKVLFLLQSNVAYNCNMQGDSGLHSETYRQVKKVKYGARPTRWPVE